LAGEKATFQEDWHSIFPRSSLHDAVKRTEGNKKAKLWEPCGLTGTELGSVNFPVIKSWVWGHFFSLFFVSLRQPKND
jgi:hypothetical protein